MDNIDLNSPIIFKYASLRFFDIGEYHVTRFCRENVLLLVFEGVLRFTEDGVPCEVSAGEYYVQRKETYHEGELVSDAPKYLYVHFDAEWTDDPTSLPRRGTFNHTHLAELIHKIDRASHQNHAHAECEYLFLKLLLHLKDKPTESPAAKRFSEYIENNIEKISSLSDICQEFHYSKNYVIQIFNREFGVSPFQYINDIKIKRAMYLIETTSRPIGDIAKECGYADYPYFYKRFMQKTGVSPMEWRRRMQENPSLW